MTTDVEKSSMTYRKVDHRQHVLLRPGMYVGSTQIDRAVMWAFFRDASAESERRLMRREIAYVPALLKVFDEVLVNAIDHASRLKQRAEGVKDGESVVPVRNIRVAFDTATGAIEITNDGEGIDVERHSEYDDVWVPELIFGHLLTSANYDDDENEPRIVGGQNGIGAKACNIFSKRFEIETVDHRRKRVYNQVFEHNMSVALPPTIKYCAKRPYTTVRFVPDYARLSMSDGRLSDDMHALLVRRVYDTIAVTGGDVAVHLDGTRLDTRTFEAYAALYLNGVRPAAFERVNEWWDVAASVNEDGSGLQHVSFVNGIWTMRGGKHVDHVVSQITRRLCEAMNGGGSSSTVVARPHFVRDNLFVFIRATIPNPTFDSQAKETLTTPVARFGTRVELSDRFIERLLRNTDMSARVSALSAAVVDRSMRRTDGKKQATLRGIPKLDDANLAGTARSAQCTLILTEGDSAKSMALAGIDQVGRDTYGVFPLRGKVMNVCDTSPQKIADNVEITQLKRILGLETGKSYVDVRDLRYGRVMVMTDQDADGSHIKGLLFNLFRHLWPSLLRVEGFLTSLLTPIVKARRGDKVESFYNLRDFHRWRETSVGSQSNWDVKYYKGLGTSTPQEAKEYFKNLKIVAYRNRATSASITPDEDALDLAFNKKRAHDRKDWLLQHDTDATLDYGISDVTFEEFVHRDLVHFSHYDLVRSIPSVCDGLKVSQRKILYCCFKRNLVKEVRVAQLAGYVSEHAAYHHGEASLNAAIVCLAQEFVGSNNINLLLPNGQFGTRLHGGKDSGAPRYIHTALNPLTRAIFMSNDDGILRHVNDDGQPVEPQTYLPILPMVLVNGAMGIGTGFSTNVPCYNPVDLIAAIRNLLKPSEVVVDVPELVPWYRGFRGVVQRVTNESHDDADASQAAGAKYVSRGVFERAGPRDVRITELPIGTWSEDFKTTLEAYVESTDAAKGYSCNHNDVSVDFTIHFADAATVDAVLAPDATTCCGISVSRLEADLKLVSSKFLGVNNMFLFDDSGRIRKYATVRDILVDFFEVRLAAYDTRRRWMLDALNRDIEKLSERVAFLDAVITRQITLHDHSTSELDAVLESAGFTRRKNDPPHDGEDVAAEDAHNKGGFGHLLRLPMASMTPEKKRELETRLETIVARRDALIASSPRQMWSDDLDHLETKMRM